ncbi:hypothetical protein KVQ01_11270 [Escherichia coli]|uniref:hypothetical protein n=1 Tax=Escherichia coli TaxID=562 RepID=UPI001F069168|nr:hypothetical protein [Escherichia coli]MCH0685599.1 hypothetical protein [Escherichia coli]MDZ8667100.1 hypothetical protein [Escherichia coli]WRX87682.1 hypothetical protein SM938_22405 [Escherichia coli]
MSEVIDISARKQQRERDEAELRSVREMTEQCYRSIAALNERERELVNRLGINKPEDPEVA